MGCRISNHVNWIGHHIDLRRLHTGCIGRIVLVPILVWCGNVGDVVVVIVGGCGGEIKGWGNGGEGGKQWQ